eukprot:UN05197
MISTWQGVRERTPPKRTYSDSDSDSESSSSSSGRPRKRFKYDRNPLNQNALVNKLFGNYNKAKKKATP